MTEYCQRLVEVLTDYLDGALPERERAALEAHLAGCDACTEYVAQFRQTIELTGRVRAEALDPALRAGLQRAFRGWRG